MSNSGLKPTIVQPSLVDQALELALSNIFDVANSKFLAGDLVQCQQYLMLILQDSPRHLEANCLMARSLASQNLNEDALRFIEVCLQAMPNSTEFWDLYLEIVARFNDDSALAEAFALKRSLCNQVSLTSESIDPESIKKKPSKSGGSQKNLLKHVQSEKETLEYMSQLCDQKKWEELIAFANSNISSNVCIGVSWRFLGIAHLACNDFNNAESSMAESLKFLPSDPTSHFNYALLCSRRGGLEAAEKHYRLAIQLNTKFVAAYNNLGNLVLLTQRFDEAEWCFRRLIQIAPDFEVAYFNLVNVLIQKKSLLVALKEVEKFVSKFPASAQLHNALGSVLFMLKRPKDSIEPLERAIALNPEYSDALNNLGCVYFDLKEYNVAKEYLIRALERNPKIARAYACLGQIAREIDRDFDKAIEFVRKALELDPEDYVTRSSLLYMLSESEAISPEKLYWEHRQYGLKAEQKWQTKRFAHSNSREKLRQIRIGFVSGDFYKHAVSSFVEPLIAELATHADLQLYAYYNNEIEDATTELFKSTIPNWRTIIRMDDDELAVQVRTDAIDILVDLSGHTLNNRLQLFASKPAPLAVTWIGYPGTTGLETIDYFFADKFYIPYHRFDHLFSEKLAYLPCTSTFQVEPDAPLVNELPALSNSYITFGSFNRIGKINESTLRTWAQLMIAIPTSRILLGGMPVDHELSTFLEKFSSYGVKRERIDLYGRTTVGDYLKLHNLVDICLDTFPYNGGTTIHHALSMGVPTLSIDGISIAARSSAAILGQVGLEGFLAKSEDDFVRLGIEWSERIDDLAHLRRGLRRTCADSIKSCPDKLASHINKAFRYMWQLWCDGKTVESFNVEEL